MRKDELIVRRAVRLDEAQLDHIHDVIDVLLNAMEKGTLEGCLLVVVDEVKMQSGMKAGRSTAGMVSTDRASKIVIDLASKMIEELRGINKSGEPDLSQYGPIDNIKH